MNSRKTLCITYVIIGGAIRRPLRIHMKYRISRDSFIFQVLLGGAIGAPLGYSRN